VRSLDFWCWLGSVLAAAGVIGHQGYMSRVSLRHDALCHQRLSELPPGIRAEIHAIAYGDLLFAATAHISYVTTVTSAAHGLRSLKEIGFGVVPAALIATHLSVLVVCASGTSLLVLVGRATDRVICPETVPLARGVAGLRNVGPWLRARRGQGRDAVQGWTARRIERTGAVRLKMAGDERDRDWAARQLIEVPVESLYRCALDVIERQDLYIDLTDETQPRGVPVSKARVLLDRHLENALASRVFGSDGSVDFGVDLHHHVRGMVGVVQIVGGVPALTVLVTELTKEDGARQGWLERWGRRG
jgi:hypothetical protein